MLQFRDMIVYTNESFYAIKLRNDSLMFERFTLLDEWGQILDLNGRDWTMSIYCSFLENKLVLKDKDTIKY